MLRTGAGTEAFCSGGDQSVRGPGGYVGADTIPRLNVLDLQASLTWCVCTAMLSPQLMLGTFARLRGCVGHAKAVKSIQAAVLELTFILQLQMMHAELGRAPLTVSCKVALYPSTCLQWDQLNWLPFTATLTA